MSQTRTKQLVDEAILTAIPDNFDRLMDEKEAAKMVGMQRQTLAKWRMDGNPDAPPFVRIGRSARYKLSTVRAWIASRQEISCTQDAA